MKYTRFIFLVIIFLGANSIHIHYRQKLFTNNKKVTFLESMTFSQNELHLQITTRRSWIIPTESHLFLHAPHVFWVVQRAHLLSWRTHVHVLDMVLRLLPAQDRLHKCLCRISGYRPTSLYQTNDTKMGSLWVTEPQHGITKTENPLLNFKHQVWGKVMIYLPETHGFWPSLPHLPPQWYCLIWSFKAVCGPFLSLTLRFATCNLDNSEFVVTTFLIFALISLRKSNHEGKEDKWRNFSTFFHFKNVMFPKIKRMVRMLHNLCEKFFYTYIYNFFNERKNLRHKRITEYSFHTWW